MTLPNFLIIGAPKCGTTSLYHYLDQHPQIYMSPIKEPMFFVLEGKSHELPPGLEKDGKKRPVYDLEAYQSLFTNVVDEIAIGEASIQYLYSSKAPDRIKHHIPDALLIAVLRDPAERAYSSYLMSVRRGFETLGFSEAIQAELQQPESGLKWWEKRRNLEVGFYHRHLQEYYRRFHTEQIGIYFYHDLKTDPRQVMKNIFRFLGVDISFSPDLGVQHLVSGIPKNALSRLLSRTIEKMPIKGLLKSMIPARAGHRLIYAVESRIMVKPPPLEPEIRADLIEIFKEDVLKLEDLLQCDLSPWLS